MADEAGVVVTFYSFKGGVGRSMALANCGFLLGEKLAAESHKALLIDWDLEAPGLHRYFPLSESTSYQDRCGLIEYFRNIERSLSPEKYNALAADQGWSEFERLFPIDDYLIPDVAKGVDLMRAGRFQLNYTELVASFNWFGFYNSYPLIFHNVEVYLTQVGARSCMRGPCLAPRVAVSQALPE